MNLLLYTILGCFVMIMGSSCPDKWSLFKTVNKGPFYVEMDSRWFHFNVSRNTTYICHGATIEFRTHYSLVHDDYYYLKSGESSVGYYYRNNSEFGNCEKMCSEKQKTINVRYLKIRRKFCGVHCNSLVDKNFLIVSFVYRTKNCNKLHFSNWTVAINCSLSRNSKYTRLCLDCDNDRVDEKFCFGNSVKYEKCQLIWSEWSEAGPCVISGCNSTGVRIRTRKCLYEDGSEASSAQLCSNKSAIMQEECLVKIKGLLCDSKSQNTTRAMIGTLPLLPSTEKHLPALFFYVSVVVTTVFILILLIVCLLFYKSRSNRNTSVPSEDDSDTYQEVNDAAGDERTRSRHCYYYPAKINFSSINNQTFSDNSEDTQTTSFLGDYINRSNHPPINIQTNPSI